MAVQGVLDGLNQVIQGALQGQGNPMKSIPVGISPCAELLWGSMFVYRISDICQYMICINCISTCSSTLNCMTVQ